ncbi:hypothetical protein J5T34_20505 [Cupriavidus gilardii]|uniref:hypothetical protein n=1 Tax=Cupriavidus gilardii TaxID=82541 RepID=UPI001ABE503D|nr:hypothetical protein [Cupriavidus gilardii]MBO4123114.1 hypothetical protein [Cupriavidus gilardii]
MSAVEVLAPLRIETRFYAPDGTRPGWLLRLRVWPDEFSMARRPVAPSPAEFDLYDDVLRQFPADTGMQWRMLAARLGVERALWLRRTVALVADPLPHTDRSTVQPRDPAAWPDTHQPYGLPPAIQVWLVETGQAGAPTLAGTMHPNRERIAEQLGLTAFDNPAATGELPQTWWTSFQVAMDVELALEIPFPAGAQPPALDAIVVAGMGDVSPEPLIAMHAISGRLSVLRPGTPTNTVDGEATAELGGNPDAWQGIDDVPPSADSASAAVMRALAGPDAVPIKLQGGDVAASGYDPLVVHALWPVLWGHALRDVVGAGEQEVRLAEWAQMWLAPQGPCPAIRVGSQPYGLLPATVLAGWTDPDIATGQIRAWAGPWRDAAAADAAIHPGTAVGATAQHAAELLGEDTPTRRWAVRLVSTLPVVNAMRAMRGLPPLAPSAWEDQTASSLAGRKTPLSPLGAFTAQAHLPASTPEADNDDPETLRLLLDNDSEVFPLRWDRKLGLLGHLIFESLCLLRASVGRARAAIEAGQAVNPHAPLPMQASTDAWVKLVRRGYPGTPSQPQLDDLFASPDPGAQRVAKRCLRGIEALAALVQAYADDPAGVFGCVLAALDTASHRVDPWITGLACSRLHELQAARAPWRLGVYGWVDAPAPYDAANPGHGLPPGPTPAGLLHAPSHAQAMTAALLRDAAVRHPSDARWQIQIDSAKVRAAMRLAERVRLGVHPYEALGLEVERIVGDWDTVRKLREDYPMRESHAGTRCCDGARVLRLLFRPQPGDPSPPALPAGVREALATCDAALDTYADLLVADGVHALVTGHGGMGNAAMEAASGLGPPPELRAIRTPRQASSVRVSVWALLPPGNAADADAPPAVLADPAFASLLDREFGPASGWTWTVGSETVSLADVGLHGIEALALSPGELAQRPRGDRDASVSPGSGTHVGTSADIGADKLARATRLAELLGGGDSNPPVPGAIDGRDDEAAPASPLHDAMMADLAERLGALRDRLTSLLASLGTVDLNDPAAVAWSLGQCRAWGAVQADDAEPLAQALARLQTRLQATAEAGVNGLRRSIRALAGHARLPVLPLVPSLTVGALRAAMRDGGGHPRTDREWLEIVAAVRPRVAGLEAWQLDPATSPWRAAVRTADGSGDPWSPAGPVVVAYGPDPAALAGNLPKVALAGLDAWQDAIPSARHTTSAAFGFNGPKSRAPQAVLLAVPPDASRRLSEDELAALILETRQLARARACRPRPGSQVATPAPLSSLPDMFWSHWT